jgi:hypothetical protein
MTQDDLQDVRTELLVSVRVTVRYSNAVHTLLQQTLRKKKWEASTVQMR